MPRKKSSAPPPAAAETLDSLRAQLEEQRAQHEVQSAQALKLLEQKDAELKALRATATPPSGSMVRLPAATVR